MADRLTQLQDCYDQLATQFYASIRYISLHHNISPLPLPPSTNPHQLLSNSNSTPLANNNNTTNNNNHIPTSHPEPHQTLQSEQSDSRVPSAFGPEQRPDSPTTFASAQRELAHDLLLKAKQIEYLIGVLPGVENSQGKQEERIRELDVELRGVLEERALVEGMRGEWVERVEGVIANVRR